MQLGNEVFFMDLFLKRNDEDQFSTGMVGEKMKRSGGGRNPGAMGANPLGCGKRPENRRSGGDTRVVEEARVLYLPVVSDGNGGERGAF